MKFNSAKEILKFINDNHDLYSPKAEIYVFRYNEAGSIATYHISPEKATELSNKVRNSNDEYWGAFLGTGGSIWDDTSCEHYKEGITTNLEHCEELMKYDDWVITRNYIGNEGLHLEVKVAVELTRENIDDIMCGALEGGITHWCSGADVVEDDYYGEYASEQISRGGSLRLYDSEEDKTYILDLAKFISGFKIWFSKGYDVYGAVKSGEIDCCNIDAEVADAIVQCAVFGDIVYG